MSGAPFDTLSLPDLDGLTFPPVEWVIDGILPAGALALLVGRPKAGKSLLAIDMQASVALGETFIDRATAQGPALYVPAEDALRLVRDRVFVRVGDERDAPLHVMPADGSLEQFLRLDAEESFDRLAATVEALNPAIVVLDPFREFHHKKENDADDMARVLRPLRQLAHATDTAIVLIHHRNKHASDPALATRGSSAITGGVDIIMTCELSDEVDDAELSPDQTLTIRVEGRYGPRTRLSARLRTGLRWHAATPTLGNDLSAAEKVLRCLEMGGAFTADNLVEHARLPKKTVQNALTDLYKRHVIARHGAGTKGDAYRYEVARRHAGTNAGTNPDASARQKEPIRPDAERYTRATGRNGTGPLQWSHGARSCAECGGDAWWRIGAEGLFTCAVCVPPVIGAHA